MANMDNGEVTFQWGGGRDQGNPCSGPQVDVGHLLSMFAAGLMMGTPRIKTFSSDATPGKTEVSFEQWYHEAQCIQGHYPEAVVCKSIIRLLKGLGQIWPGTWGPPLASPISCENFQLFLAWWPL